MDYAPLTRDIARVLDAAKRAIVEAYRASTGPTYEDDDVDYDEGRETGLEEAVKILARVHADHPDFSQEWRY